MAHVPGLHGFGHVLPFPSLGTRPAAGLGPFCGRPGVPMRIGRVERREAA